MQQKMSNGVNVLPLLRILSSKDLAGKRVLLRADFDVAVKNGRIQDYSRINTNIPTIKFILRAGGYIRIVTHLGRPHGKVIPSLSMKKIAIQLGRMLRRKIIFLRNPYDRRSFKAYNNSPEIIFFENIRFWPGEEKNSPSFAKKLSAWGDLYVNECFATSHRKHASFVAVAHALPAFAGCYLEKEIFYLDKVLVKPRWPVVTVLGGSKLETKLPLVEVFLKKQYDVLVGGAIANTLLAARNVSVGQSLVEHDYFERVRNVLFNPRLHLPCDVVTAPALKSRSVHIVDVDRIPRNETVFDIGPRTIGQFETVLRTARTIFWNGPVGYAEIPRFARGTVALARACTQSSAFSVLGGGDTSVALRKYGVLHPVRDAERKNPRGVNAVCGTHFHVRCRKEQISNGVHGFGHVSTGGGAMLEFLAGGKLPGIEALKRKNSISKYPISKRV
ncbi:MAG: phosphoglycerate kinase [Candidatus Sungbacteria bacterium RIFCSPHIGHO2_02_FULL_47_11]|uniref:Phosphoglycerate kinase n=1 Tax=Candidatus Sungbacteria bacterium RIFCSPHIGHO2_02_FULL_47_11 TaxID=1802270 RepID=A0A1G2KLQ8_9BACT|nr:MAG: phosphoglycerate kinase [Candidatus Sungbacteria bacterium RIFCSPHIGHO2_02_FULL_47_11]